MFLISTLLMTAWMLSVVLGWTVGGAIHVLPLGAAAIVFLTGNRPASRAR